VVGRPGLNLQEGEALDVVFGYTLVNEWIAASSEGEEERVATSVGPCVVTIDEFDPSRRMLVVRVDGRRVATSPVGVAVARAFARSLARASRGSPVQPGEIYGLRPLRRPLEVRVPRRRGRGDPVVVAVEVPGIGALETPVSR
jgi:2-keto-4-pentenoate hydratase/2-oxohepta-3-ene-1,7-dioic acid hydratase in catechol pathway